MASHVDSKLKLYLPVFLPIITIAIVGFLLFLPETLAVIYGKTVYVPVLSGLTFLEKFNTLLVVAIATFACVESYSTYLQNILEQKRNLVIDTRNELEKAYGPLFAILNYRAKIEEKTLKITQSDFRTIDEIMAVYVWIFSEETNDLWNKIRRPVPSIIVSRWIAPEQEPVHDVSFEFRDKINEEYNVNVKKYNDLLGKT